MLTSNAGPASVIVDGTIFPAVVNRPGDTISMASVAAGRNPGAEQLLETRQQRKNGRCINAQPLSIENRAGRGLPFFLSETKYIRNFGDVIRILSAGRKFAGTVN